MKYYLLGCSRKYQLNNIITARYRATNHFNIEADGEIRVVKVDMVSEEGLYWYPLCGLTRELSEV